MHLFRATAIAACTFLAACSFGATPAPAPEPPAEEQPAPEPSVRETENVTYTGVVKPAGISVYQQGSHRLVLDDGRFILLESTAVDLNGYVDESVEVFGAIRPTVEDGGMIMRVENIHLTDTEPAAQTGSTVPVTDTGSVMPSSEQPSEEQPIPEQPVSSAPSEEEPEEPEEPATPEEPVQQPASVEQEAAITAMAAEDLAPERWTQRYCTGHIGFCFPVHKNWWYQSFGNTTSHLWHVEIGNAAIDEIGQGVIIVKLVSGTVASAGASDGQVSVQGSVVTGYRAWQDDSHFEIIADTRLEAAVRYITAQLTAFAG